MSKGDLMGLLANNPKVIEATNSMISSTEGKCPPELNIYPKDPPLGDVKYVIDTWRKQAPTTQEAVREFINVIMDTSQFKALHISGKRIEQSWRLKFGIIAKKGPTNQPLPGQAGQHYVGQYVPAQSWIRHETEKQGNAKIVSNLSEEVGQGDLINTAHPDVYCDNQAVPSITSLHESMTDLSTAACYPADLLGKTREQPRIGEADTKIMKDHPTELASHQDKHKDTKNLKRKGVSIPAYSKKETQLSIYDKKLPETKQLESKRPSLGNLVAIGASRITNMTEELKGDDDSELFYFEPIASEDKEETKSRAPTPIPDDARAPTPTQYFPPTSRGRTPTSRGPTPTPTQEPTLSEEQTLSFFGPIEHPKFRKHLDTRRDDHHLEQFLKREKRISDWEDTHLIAPQVSAQPRELENQEMVTPDTPGIMWHVPGAVALPPLAGPNIPRSVSEISDINERRSAHSRPTDDPTNDKKVKLMGGPTQLEGIMDYRRDQRGKGTMLSHEKGHEPVGIDPELRDNDVFFNRGGEGAQETKGEYELIETSAKKGHIVEMLKKVLNAGASTVDEALAILGFAGQALSDITADAREVIHTFITRVNDGAVAAATDVKKKEELIRTMADYVMIAVASNTAPTASTTKSQTSVTTNQQTGTGGNSSAGGGPGQQDITNNQTPSSTPAAPEAQPPQPGSTDNKGSTNQGQLNPVSTETKQISDSASGRNEDPPAPDPGLGRNNSGRVGHGLHETPRVDTKKHLLGARLSNADYRKNAEAVLDSLETRDAKKEDKKGVYRQSGVAYRWVGNPLHRYITSGKHDSAVAFINSLPANGRQRNRLIDKFNEDYDNNFINLYTSLSQKHDERHPYDDNPLLFLPELIASNRAYLKHGQYPTKPTLPQNKRKTGIDFENKHAPGRTPQENVDIRKRNENKYIAENRDLEETKRQQDYENEQNLPGADETRGLISKDAIKAKEDRYTQRDARGQGASIKNLDQNGNQTALTGSLEGTANNDPRSNLIQVEANQSMLRPSFPEGGANKVLEINNDPSLQLIDRLEWQAFNNYTWEANEESDNLLKGMNLVDDWRRFKGMNDQEELLPQMAADADAESYNTRMEAFSLPENMAADTAEEMWDIVPPPYNIEGPISVENAFHDVYIPDWHSIPEDSPWKKMTQVNGTQLPDSQLKNSGRVMGNDWSSGRWENDYLGWSLA